MKAWSLGVLAALSGCGDPAEEPASKGRKVETTGKVPAALANVPPEVLDAARVAQPQMRFAEAEAETRDGRDYYDVAGILPDGSEIELDLLREPSGWRVVETQRDIPFASAPRLVRARFEDSKAAFQPARVIESRQSDGIVIYELFGPAAAGAEPPKIEIKWDGKEAQLLTDEWAH